MQKLLLTAITSAVLLLLPSFSHAQTDNPQLTGTVAYRERIALPPDAVIAVQLIDTSVADVAAQTVAEILINAEGRQVPVPFTLTYDPAKIVPANRYSVRATIRSGDGMLMFSSTQAYPALTHGAPSKVNLVLHTVGHGAHPSSAKNKEAEPTTAEVTPPSTTPEPASTVETATAGKAPAQADQSTAVEHASAQPVSSAPMTEPASSTNGQSASEPAPSQNAMPAAETPVQTPAAAQEQASPAAPPASATALAPEAESSSRDTKPVETQPAASGPAPPAPETKSAEPPLPDSPSTTKRAELAAAASAESEEAAPDSVPAARAPNKALTPLADTQWKLIQLGGLPVVIAPSQKPVTLAFSPEGRRIAGSAGCNSYLGTFTDEQGHLQMHPGGMTMMACADPAGSREKKFVAMLRSADGYRISGGFLLLTSNGKTVAKFQNSQE